MHTRNRLRLVISALAIAFGFVAGTASAQGAKSVINAAAITNYPPFEYRDPASNQLQGFDIDIVDAIAAKMGAKVNWIETSFDQIASSISTKRADVAVASMGDTAERRASMSFVDYLTDNSVFFTLRANAAEFPNMAALCGKRVAAARTTLWPAAIAKWSDEHCVKAGKPAIVVVGTNSSADSRLQLNQNRADVSVQSAATLAYQNTLESNRYFTVGTPFFSQLSGIAFSKDDPQFGLAVKKALAALITDGTYQKLMRKWNIPDASALEQPMINGQP